MRKAIQGYMASAALVFMASSALADNRSRVDAFVLNDGTFEVVAEFTENALYWCGASEAARIAALPNTQRLYVLNGPAPSQAVPGARAVRFGVTPPDGGASGSSFTNSVNVVGNSLTVFQARQTCNERSASG